MIDSTYSTSSSERPSRDLFYSWFSNGTYWVRTVACILRVFFNVEAGPSGASSFFSVYEICILLKIE